MVHRLLTAHNVANALLLLQYPMARQYVVVPNTKHTVGLSHETNVAWCLAMYLATKWLNAGNIDAWLTRLSETPGWKAPYDLMPGSPADRA